MKYARFSRFSVVRRLDRYINNAKAMPVGPRQEAVLDFLFQFRAEVAAWTRSKKIKGNLYGSRAVRGLL